MNTSKYKNPLVWKNTLKVGLLILVTVVVFAVLFNSFSSVKSGDWSQVVQENFADGKALGFFLPKVLFSFAYAFYLSLKNTK